MAKSNAKIRRMRQRYTIPHNTVSRYFTEIERVFQPRNKFVVELEVFSVKPVVQLDQRFKSPNPSNEINVSDTNHDCGNLGEVVHETRS